jgi:hypothetical protein
MIRAWWAVRANLLIAQPVWSAIQELAGRVANTIVGWASIEAFPELQSEIAHMGRTLIEGSTQGGSRVVRGKAPLPLIA